MLTDALSNVIINEKIVPEFRKGDIGAGVTAGVDAMLAQLAADPEVARATAAQATVEHAQARASFVGRPRCVVSGWRSSSSG